VTVLVTITFSSTNPSSQFEKMIAWGRAKDKIRFRVICIEMGAPAFGMPVRGHLRIKKTS
jgi:hypothetical protein